MAETVTIKPSGHRSKRTRDYTQPHNEAVTRVNAILDKLARKVPKLEYQSDLERLNYVTAQLLKEDPLDITSAHAAVMTPELLNPERSPDRNCAIGLLLSCAYMSSNQQVIVFDLDLPEIPYIGYKQKKVLINKGVTGYAFGYESMGVLINRGETPTLCGFHGSGMLINDGIAGEEFASLFMGTIVALKPPAGVDKEKIVLQPPNVSRDFCAYLDELCSCPEQSLQQYGSKDYIRSELHKRIDRNLDIAFERRRKELMAKRR